MFCMFQMQNKKPKSGQMFPKNQERVSQAIHLFPKKLYFQDRSAIISSPTSSSERSGEGEVGDEMR